jgi:mannose-1-phosphate guanylyltransferase
MYSVIMAGGSGTRFWPASRRLRPKQLLALTGGRSLLQQTVDRMAPLTPPEQTLVVTGADQAPAVAEQLPELPAGQVLGEPQARNTAPAAGLAAAWVALQDPEAVCIVLPADHLVTGEALFHRTLQRAMEVARSGDHLVTLGITPRYAATGFGYIELGPEAEAGEPRVHQVAAFHEKPDQATARDYLEGGRHLWNAGMFVWRAKVLLEEMLVHQPELAKGLAELIPHLGGPEEAQALERVYPELPKISIDHGVLEKSSRLRVVRADFGWSDVGSWEAMAELWEPDQAGNASQDGEVLAIEAKGNLVSAGGRLAALVGVDNLVAVVTDDALLILPRHRAQEVGRVVEELKARGKKEHL